MHTVQEQVRPSIPAPASGPPTALRIDAPHVIAGAAESGTRSDAAPSSPIELPIEPPPPAEELAAAAGQATERQAEQMRSQARQLAGHLRAKQRDLDRREAELHALAAKVENDGRINRLWLRERQHELGEREAALAQTTADVEARCAGVTASELTIDRDLELARGELASRERELTQRESELAQRERELAQRDLEFQQQQDVLQRQAAELAEVERAVANEAQAKAHKLRERDRLLSESELRLEQQTAQLVADRRELELKRQRFTEQMQHDVRLAARRRDEAECDLGRQRQTLQERGAALEQREAAVEQLQADVTRMHREALELRLVAEQVWAQLAGAAAPAELTHSLGRARARLAEHFRLAEEGLAEQRQELRELAARLDQRQQEAVRHRADLSAWHSARQEEIEEQAARLVAREQELDRQERQFRQAEETLSAERRQHEHELRRLLAQLRAGEPAACCS